MNLTKLFEMQRELDNRIISEKGLEGKDLLPQKILALQVELGECANEWRGFKFWSENQESRTVKYREKLMTYPDGEQYIGHEKYNPLLEEYIDCLHFLLSIGLETDIDTQDFGFVELVRDTTNETFLAVFEKINEFWYDSDDWNYEQTMNIFAGLGKMLGFTWEQIESEYMAKNEINHKRQSSGY